MKSNFILLFSLCYHFQIFLCQNSFLAPNYQPAPSSSFQPYNPQKITMSPSTFLSELSDKIKSLKLDKMNPSPIIINGGNLPALHIYHQPMWLPPITRNTHDEYRELKDLERLNSKIDQEIRMRDPGYRNETLFEQKIMIGNLNQVKNSPPQGEIQKEIINHEIVGKANNLYEVDNTQNIYPQFKEKPQSRNQSLNDYAPDNYQIFKGNNLQDEFHLLKNFDALNSTNELFSNLGPNTQNNKILKLIDNPKCVEKNGYLKVREKDSLEKEIPRMYAILKKDRLTYYLDEKDESSIQGSIELKLVLTPLNVIMDKKNCFELSTQNKIQDMVICSESENEMSDWLTSLTQNIVNCN